MISSFARPDGRVVVRPAGGWDAKQARAAVELARSRRVPVIATVDADAGAEHQALLGAGFATSRRETHVELSVESALASLEDAALPPGIVVRSALEVDAERLRLLDDRLRDDVPGTSGWHWDPSGFREETFETAAFDPDTYLVAVDGSGEYVGLVRIWMNPGAPRLGLAGVVRPQRRRGIAAGVLAQALEAVRASGATKVTAEYDDANAASRAIADKLGARVVGATIEFSYVRA